MVDDIMCPQAVCRGPMGQQCFYSQNGVVTAITRRSGMSPMGLKGMQSSDRRRSRLPALCWVRMAGAALRTLRRVCGGRTSDSELNNCGSLRPRRPFRLPSFHLPLGGYLLLQMAQLGFTNGAIRAAVSWHHLWFHTNLFAVLTFYY